MLIATMPVHETYLAV